MKMRYITTILVILAGLVGVTSLLCLVYTTRASVFTHPNEFGIPFQIASSPMVTSITPNTAPNDLDTPVIINGTAFQELISGTQVITPVIVTIGSSMLENVQLVSSTTLSTTIPWGLTPAIYTLTVINSDGVSGSLLEAFTVTRGIGTWTTGGPYGGSPIQLLPDPTIVGKIFAVTSVGVFVSEDSAANWKYILPNSWPIHLSMSPVNSQLLYLGSHYGLQRSLDGGNTWLEINLPEQYQHQPNYPIAHPSSPEVVLVALSYTPDTVDPQNRSGVYRSSDYGVSWTRLVNGLNDTDVTVLTYYPNDPSGNRILAGTDNGNLYYSSDGGSHWQWKAKVCENIFKILVNPNKTDEVWVIRYDVHYPGTSLFKSSNGDLNVWQPVYATSIPNEWPQELVFAADGTLWIGIRNSVSGGVYFSNNGGDTWIQKGNAPPDVISLTIDPNNQQVIYAGVYNGPGVYQSMDRGNTWHQVNNGLAGITAEALAVSPSDPQRVYAATDELGLLKSLDGGSSWQPMNISCYGFVWAGGEHRLAADPFIPTRLYLGGQIAPPLSKPSLKIGQSDGSGWHEITFTVPVPANEWSGQVFIVKPHPSRPGRLLAGLAYFHIPTFNFSYPLSAGGIFASDDYGESWHQVTTSQPISRVTGIVFDAFNPDVIFSSTDGSGFLKSVDGGESWHGMQNLPPNADCSRGTVLTHPIQSGHVLAMCDQATLRSLDAGTTWIQLNPFYGLASFVPSDPVILYRGDRAQTIGLMKSLDNGDTWEQDNGIALDANIFAFANSIQGQRIFMYVSTSGGFATSGQSVTDPFTSVSHGIMTAGVYRFTTLLPTYSYLPMLSR